MTTPNLAAALAKVQAKLPKLERDRTVTVEPKDPKKAPYSYSYRTLASLPDAILPLLADNGLSFVAMPGAGSDGKMCIRYHLLHESGESLTGALTGLCGALSRTWAAVLRQAGFVVLVGSDAHDRSEAVAAGVGDSAANHLDSALAGDRELASQ